SASAGATASAASALLAEEQLESLDSDWVPVNRCVVEHQQQQQSPVILDFRVSWNQDSCSITINCTERKSKQQQQPPQSFMGVYTLFELSCINSQLCLLNPQLQRYFPEQPHPACSRGFLASFLSGPVVNQTYLDSLTVYLKAAVDLCGARFVIDALFEELPAEDFFDSLSSLKENWHLDRIAKQKEQLEGLEFYRKQCVTLMELVSLVFQPEDEIMQRLANYLAEHFAFHLRPRVTLRGLAQYNIAMLKSRLDATPETEDTNAIGLEITDWIESFESSNQSIIELYCDYYTKLADMYEKALQRMDNACKKFGKNALASIQYVGERRESLQRRQLTEQTQRLRTEACRIENKVKLRKQEILSLAATQLSVEQIRAQTDRLELAVHRLQLKLFDARLRALDSEERLLNMERRLELDRCRTIDDERDEFFDAVEDLRSLRQMPDAPCPVTGGAKSDRLRRLDADLAALRSRKAAIRGAAQRLRDRRVASARDSEEAREASARREAAVSAEERARERREEERRRTAERLKQYRAKQREAARERRGLPPVATSSSQGSSSSKNQQQKSQTGDEECREAKIP
ncbi:hypothetical protein BOX15_Mlig011356g2, partial [Macrostomum lignano]